MKFIFVLIFMTVGATAQANIGQTYGFGSRTASLGGAAAAWGFDSYAAYDNPAGLAQDSERRLKLGWGVLFMHPYFTPISGVVVQDKFTSDVASTGDITMDYRDTFAQEIGLSYSLFPQIGNLTFGLVIALPINQVAYMDSGETFVPEYFQYRARTQRPQVEAGLGANLGHGLKVGAGLHVAFSLSSNANVFINTNPPSNASSMRFSASLQPRVAPYFGLLLTPVEEHDPAYTVGLVFRMPVSSTNNITVNTAARVFGDFAALNFNFTGSSALFYDPISLELGTSIRHGWGRLYGQLEYQAWSRFVPPVLSIQTPSITCTDGSGSACTNGITLAPSQNPNFTYVDILVPRIGEEIPLGTMVTLRGGYSYRASILAAIPNGPGNYIDPPVHSISAGVGLHFQHFLVFSTPTDLDFNAAYDILVSQQVTKGTGLENGNPVGQMVGSPGYQTGGGIFGGGLTLSLAF